jgi:hypothetical protein
MGKSTNHFVGEFVDGRNIKSRNMNNVLDDLL